MSQRDLVAELRAARVEAPPQVRERVRLVAAAAPAPLHRFTWRRAFVVAIPVAAAIAATFVVTRPTSHQTTCTTSFPPTPIVISSARSASPCRRRSPTTPTI